MTNNYNNIPHNYAVSRKSNKFNVFWISYSDLLSITDFTSSLTNFLQPSNQYTILVKVRYDSNNFAMAGHQIPFMFKDYKDPIKFHGLQSDIIARLNVLLDNYGIYDGDINLIQIMYKLVDNKFIKKFSYDNIKPVTTVQTYRNISRTSRYLSLSFDILSHGLQVIPEITNTTYKVIIPKTSVSKEFDFMTNFKLNNNIIDIKLHFNKNDLFFINTVDKTKVVIVISILSANCHIKRAYTLSGLILCKVEDTNLITHIQRKLNNYTFFYKNNHISFIEKNITFSPLKRVYKNEKKFIENIRIGTLDVETYTDVNGIAKVYCLGFYTNIDHKPITFYIDKKNRDSDSIILQCINEMLRSKYEGITYYAHNLGNYDVVFILKTLLEYNKITGNNPYILDVICRDDVILKLSIKRKISNTIHYINILDSYCILKDSLKNLCIRYSVNVLKGDFPYKFSSENTLFYVGETPNVNYYKSKENYVKTNLWNFKSESLSYLCDDLVGLYQVLSKVNKTIFLDFSVDMTKCLTISKLAYEIFIKDYVSTDKPIPIINNRKVFEDLKLGYYGGITEVYKPYGENLYYYDVNSLYPYESLNAMVGLNCNKQDYLDHSVDLNSLFGFFYCDIIAPQNDYLGLLPYRNGNGILQPVGKWSGMYFTEELKYACDNGYIVSVKWGYNFDKSKNVFSGYVKELYNMKSNPQNITQKNISKSLLNNLLGRFGMDFTKPITDVVDQETFDKLELTRKITSYKDITSNDVLVTYSPDIDKTVCHAYNVDYNKIIKEYSKETTSNFKGVSIPISAAVTAYGRIHINKIKNYILKQGGYLYYSDTDSVVTNIKLPECMVGTGLGKLKMEYFIKRAYFISNKTYCLVLENGKTIIKAKGVNNNTLTEEDFISMLKGNFIDTAIKTYSTKDYFNGSVSISDKNVNLSGNSYTKRTKLYDLNNNWIDTKPLVLT